MIDKEICYPKHWELKRFDDLLDYIQPTRYIVVSTDYSDKYKTPVLTAGKSFIKGYTNEKNGIYEVLPVIIFDDFTTANKFVNFPFKVKSSAMKILRQKNETVNIKFVYYYMQTIRISSDTHKRYWISEYSKLPIPFPPLPEQQAIVSKIEELLSDLENGKQQLQTAQQQLKLYRQSLLKWAFEGRLTNKNVKAGELPKGWKIVKVGDVCKCIVPNRDKPKSFSGNIGWVTTPNLTPGSIRLNYSDISMGLTEDEVRKYNARVIPVGGVIMTCVGSFGLSAIVEKLIVINQQLHAFIPNGFVNSKYLAYCIQNNRYFFEKKSTSTTIQYLNKENCNAMPLPLCTIKEQQQIVDELEGKLTVCDKIEKTISDSLLQAEALKQSILKSAFEGKLVKI